jgi:hypothetical protein
MGNSASSEVKKEDENGEDNFIPWFGQCCASRKPANRDVVSEETFGVQDMISNRYITCIWLTNTHLAHKHT